MFVGRWVHCLSYEYYKALLVIFSDGDLREANNGDLTVKERTRVKLVYVVVRLPLCPLIFI